MLKKKKILFIFVTCVLIACITTGCGKENADKRKKDSEKPRTSIVGEWYYTGKNISDKHGIFLHDKITYEPSFEFFEDGTFVDRVIFGSPYQVLEGTYIVDEVSNNLHLICEEESKTFTVEPGRTQDGWSFDGSELTIYGYIFKTSMPKGELFDQIKGTWKIDGEKHRDDTSSFVELTFNEDGTFRGSDAENTEYVGYFAINEAEYILSIAWIKEPNNFLYGACFGWNMFESKSEEYNGCNCWGLRDEKTLNFVGTTFLKQ